MWSFLNQGRGERRQPAIGYIKKTPHNQRADLLLHQAGNPPQVTSLPRMGNGFVDQTLRLKPQAGSSVQFSQALRLGLAQALLQHAGKKMMIAIPIPFIIQWNDKQISLFKLVEHGTGRLWALLPQHSITERAAHAR